MTTTRRQRASVKTKKRNTMVYNRRRRDVPDGSGLRDDLFSLHGQRPPASWRNTHIPYIMT